MLLLAAGLAWAQAPGSQLPSFAVTSVRPFQPTGPWHRLARYDPQRLYIEGMSPMELIQEAYGVNTNQISGLTGWASWVNSFFTVTGTTDAPATPDQMRLMLRRLLQDRFQLGFNDTAAVRPVYALVLAGKDLKVQPLNPGESCSDANQARRKRETAGLGNYSVGFTQCTMAALVSSLNLQNSVGGLDRPVVDQTGLRGDYPLLLWRAMDDVQPRPDGRGFTVGHSESIQDALGDELGLKLVKTAAPYRVLVITHIAQPGPD